MVVWRVEGYVRDCFRVRGCSSGWIGNAPIRRTDCVGPQIPVDQKSFQYKIAKRFYMDRASTALS